jgi:hypothetical protein
MNFLNAYYVNNTQGDVGVLGLAPTPSAKEPYKSLVLKLAESGVISK